MVDKNRITLEECATRLGMSVVEIRELVKEKGLRTRPTKNTRIDDTELEALSSFIQEKKTSIDKTDYNKSIVDNNATSTQSTKAVVVRKEVKEVKPLFVPNQKDIKITSQSSPQKTITSSRLSTMRKVEGAQVTERKIRRIKPRQPMVFTEKEEDQLSPPPSSIPAQALPEEEQKSTSNITSSELSSDTPLKTSLPLPDTEVDTKIEADTKIETDTKVETEVTENTELEESKKSAVIELEKNKPSKKEEIASNFSNKQPQPFSNERLYELQVKKGQEKLRKAEETTKKEEQAAKAQKEIKSQKKAGSARGAEKEKKTGTIRIDPKALSAYKKKKRQSISRSEAREKTADSQQIFHKPTAPIVRDVKISEAVSISQLASDMSLKASVIIRKLMEQGMMVTANESLDRDTAWIIVEELGHNPVDAPLTDEEQELLGQDIEDDFQYENCAPVVTVMGHVDHGKTSLLDYIRKTRVASSEFGGITQHIGAYRVDTSFGPVSFVDTPGHELFAEMRSRGAKITDIVVLVVATDDGVKPQTVEAINHAKASEVPIIVAASKIDKHESNLDKVKRELSENGVLPEDWGGDSFVIPISAHTGEGVNELLDALAMQADLLELKAPINVHASGVVVESRIDKGRGIVATVIITKGILKLGDIFICGTESGRVRAMWDSSHPKLKEARPSMPVEIQGLSGVPAAGAELLVVGDERKARNVAMLRQNKLRAKRLTRHLPTAVDQQSILDSVAGENQMKELNVVIKTDVEGAREAMVSALSAIAGSKAAVKVIHSGVGAVTESDIYLAQAGDGIVVAFNVRPDSRVRKTAESRGVSVIMGNVVYELVEKVEAAVLNLLPPIIEEKTMGVAEVLQIFNVSRMGQVAGCRVIDGVISSRSLVRVIRDGVDIYNGRIDSLRHFKDEVSEVRLGSECGISIAKFNNIKVGDKIEAIERTETADTM